MVALNIRRGTTKTFVLSIEDENRTWEDYGTVLLRITQDELTIDKKLEVFSNEGKDAKVDLSQEETLRLKDSKKFKMQLFSVKGNSEVEIAIKSDIYYGNVLPSLWNEVVHDE